MANQVIGQFFERIKIIVNGKTELEFPGLFRASVTGDEQVSRVESFSANHKISGVVRGNGQYDFSFASYLNFGKMPFDWRTIDYDSQVLDIALLLPKANYGTNNVFEGSNKYLLCNGCVLARHTPLSTPGVGQAGTEEFDFILVDWQWVGSNNPII